MKIKLEEQSIQEVEGFSYFISYFVFFLLHFIVQPNCVYTYKVAFLKDFQLPSSYSTSYLSLRLHSQTS